MTQLQVPFSVQNNVSTQIFCLDVFQYEGSDTTMSCVKCIDKMCCSVMLQVNRTLESCVNDRITYQVLCTCNMKQRVVSAGPISMQ